MQFLSENGRVHKFANSFCSLAFTLQKVRLDGNDLPQDVYDNSDDTSSTEAKGTKDSATVSVKLSYLQSWNDYVAKMSTALFSFLLPSEVSKPHKAQASTGRSNLLMSPAYVELSVKWVIRVLLIVFPCIKACSNQKELPNHLRYILKCLHILIFSFFT